MLGFVEAGNLLARDSGQHPVERLDQNHRLAELAQRRGRLEADIAAADDRQPPVRAERTANLVRIGHVAQIVDTGEIGAGHVQPARA